MPPPCCRLRAASFRLTKMLAISSGMAPATKQLNRVTSRPVPAPARTWPAGRKQNSDKVSKIGDASKLAHVRVQTTPRQHGSRSPVRPSRQWPIRRLYTGASSPRFDARCRSSVFILAWPMIRAKAQKSLDRGQKGFNRRFGHRLRILAALLPRSVLWPAQWLLPVESKIHGGVGPVLLPAGTRSRRFLDV